MKILSTLSFQLCLSVYQNVVINAQPWTSNEVQLDDKFKLTWTLGKESVIYFEIIAKTNGWVGLGFTKEHGMTNADIVVAGQDDAGMGYVSDYFSTGEGTPQLDDQQNYEIEYTFAGEGPQEKLTVVNLKRLLDTGDPKDHKIQNETIELIWALHTSDMTTTSFPQHTSRGHVRLNLLDYRGVEDVSDGDSMSTSTPSSSTSSTSPPSTSTPSTSTPLRFPKLQKRNPLKWNQQNRNQLNRNPLSRSLQRKDSSTAIKC